MELTEIELIEKKEEIQKTKSELDQLKGQQKVLKKRLKDDWQCATLAQAKKKINGLKTKIETLQQEIEESTEELVEKYFSDDTE
jgi:uncharacterized protein involved in exopolysaccharide biosynthesis